MRRLSLHSLSLLTLDFSWPGPAGYLAASSSSSSSSSSPSCCCCTESTGCRCRSWRSRPVSRILPSFRPSCYNIKGLEVKLPAESYCCYINSSSPQYSPVQAHREAASLQNSMALQNLLSALRIIQQRLCRNFILTFSWPGRPVQLSGVVTLAAVTGARQAGRAVHWNTGTREL